MRLRSAGGTQYAAELRELRAHASAATARAADGAPHVDKYLLRDGNVIGQLEALLCDVGSRVHEDEETAVIETDKVAISVRAPESGVVTAVLKGVGDWVAVGDPVYAFAPEAAAVGERQWAAERARELAEARRLQDAHDAQVMAEIERQARARNEARAFERRAQAARAEAFGGCAAIARSLRSRAAGRRWRQSRRRAQPPPGGGRRPRRRRRARRARREARRVARRDQGRLPAQGAEVPPGSRPERRRAAQVFGRAASAGRALGRLVDRNTKYNDDTRVFKTPLILALLDRLAGEQVQKIVARLADLLELALHLAARVGLARRL